MWDGDKFCGSKMQKGDSNETVTGGRKDLNGRVKFMQTPEGMEGWATQLSGGRHFGRGNGEHNDLEMWEFPVLALVSHFCLSGMGFEEKTWSVIGSVLRITCEGEDGGLD